jgi:hypothetical protein
MSRSDLKEIGELLDESDAAFMVVGDDRADCWEAAERAKKEMKKEVRALAKQIE